MTVVVSDNPFVVSSTQPIALSGLFSVTAGSDPTYLVLNAFDRDEYVAGASGSTGSLAGFGLTTMNGDAREIGIVFKYQTLTGRYFNSSIGYLDQLTYTPSSSLGDITDLSFFGTGSQSTANAYANNVLDLATVDPNGFLGTVTVATEPNFSGPAPSQATPDSIAAIAQSFVGQNWNMNGCWILTSTISAEAGASLPVQSTADMAGAANGEWFVAFNGPAGASGDWQSMVTTGDMIGFITGSGSGHITTVVSGSGASAQLIDNITYVNGSGAVLNPGSDGSPNDVTIEAAHAASQEWAGVAASSVVIFRLDTPVVSDTTGPLSLTGGTDENLGSLFSAADPEGKAVTEFQVYNANSGNTLVVNGSSVDALSAASAASAGALSQVTLDTGPAAGADTITVRAFNGAYWGDWTSLGVTTSASSSPSAASAVTPARVIVPTSTIAPTDTAALTADTVAVFRFFDDTDGAHFFTASTTERDTLIATRPDLTYEGVGMDAISSSAASSDPAAESVYRFFDAANGTHFYTANLSETNSLITSDSSLTFEGTAFYEDSSQQAGDTAVYRFFDTNNGTHLYTQSAAEIASITATRPDLRPEGIAFYAPQLS